MGVRERWRRKMNKEELLSIFEKDGIKLENIVLKSVTKTTIRGRLIDFSLSFEEPRKNKVLKEETN